MPDELIARQKEELAGRAEAKGLDSWTKVTAWHEVYGKQAREVTITGTETQALNFTFKAN